MACYNIYLCRDGRALAVAALESKFWEAFCHAVEHPEWILLQTDFSRAAELCSEVAEMFAQEDSIHWLAKLDQVDCCVELVALPQEIPEHPQHRARGVIADGPCLRLPALEIHGSSRNTAQTDLRAGAETRDVLAGLGLSDEAINALIDQGAAVQA